MTCQCEPGSTCPKFDIRLTPGLIAKCRAGKLRKPRRVPLPVAALNYVTSTVKHVATGSKLVDDETFNQRRALCDSCDQRDATTDTCNLCGCPLNETILGDKLRRATSSCPLDKWGKV